MGGAQARPPCAGSGRGLQDHPRGQERPCRAREVDQVRASQAEGSTGAEARRLDWKNEEAGGYRGQGSGRAR